MPVPILASAPPAPARTQDNATFNTRMAAMMAFLEGFPDDLNEFAAALADLVAVVFTATSATNVAIGLGAKHFAASPGAAFIPGHHLLITSRGSPTNNMRGEVTAYNSATGSLDVSVASVAGAGNFADWDIAVTVGQGAPLASPAFTGIPTAPTAAQGTNTTQIATTQFVVTESVARAAAAVANVVNSSPATLDTLNELAAALGNDPNFASTMATALGLRALLTANTFSGKQTLAASVVGAASMNIPHGVAPSAPVDGDVWTTTAGMFLRANGVTYGPFLGPSAYSQIAQQASTSGTLITFSGIPQTYNNLLFNFDGVSANAASNNLTVAFSTDGSTWSAPVNVMPLASAATTVYGGMSIPGYRKGVGTAPISLFDGTTGVLLATGQVNSLAYRLANGVQAVRFGLTTGAFDAGTITLFGI